jgi:pilus assembly protein CpaE
MPDGADNAAEVTATSVAPPHATLEPSAPHRISTRHGRPVLIAFVTDAASERAFSDGLADVLPGGVDVRRGGIRAAIASMQKATTPSVLAVDISGEDQPLTALAQLANVVEPDVSVLVIGELDSVDFYREITRSLGAHDYLSKPLTNDKIARYVGTLVLGQVPTPEGVQGGNLVIITGVRGGVGATTLAVNLASHFGVSMRRHTVLFDPDVHLGDASFLLNVKPGPGLRMALETPERIDALLAERAAQPAAERLDVLSSEEPLTDKLNYAPGGVTKLLAALRRRYNFIVADVPFRQGSLNDELLDLVHQRVLVMVPTLTSVRATLRLLPMANKAEQPKRPVIVLNRVGSPGSLTRRQVEDALSMKVDVAVPDQPRQVEGAATMGELAMIHNNGFRNGILELARHVAFVGLLDSTVGTGPAHGENSVRRAWRLFRRKP